MDVNGKMHIFAPIRLQQLPTVANEAMLKAKPFKCSNKVIKRKNQSIVSMTPVMITEKKNMRCHEWLVLHIHAFCTSATHA